MEPQITENIKEVSSQLKDVMAVPVGKYRAMVKIDEKIKPIIESLLKWPGALNAENQLKHAFKQLLEWFMHPKRIVEDFIYILGPLVHNVKIRVEQEQADQFESYIVEGMNYLGIAVLEALAIKCPVLDGNWEICLWLIMKLLCCYGLEGSRYAPRLTKQLNTWIIHMVGDADVCPNPHLRIELIKLIDLVEIDQHNRMQAFNAVMDACSNLNKEYLARNEKSHWNDEDYHLRYHSDSWSVSGSNSDSDSNSVFDSESDSDHDYESDSNSLNNDRTRKSKEWNYNGCSTISLSTIVNTLSLTLDIEDSNHPLASYTKRLVDELDNINSARMSCVVNVFTYNCGINPNKCKEPRELKSLIALLNIASEFIHEEFEKVKRQKRKYVLPTKKKCIMDISELLMENVKVWHRIPQLTNSTASFIINLLEFITTNDFYLPKNAAYEWYSSTPHPPMRLFYYMLERRKSEPTYMMVFECKLKEILIASNLNTTDKSPIGQQLISHYSSRLKMLKVLRKDLDNFPTIHSLMKYV